MHRAEPTVRCPIFVFDEQEKEIRKLTKLINTTRDPSDKERYAKMMLEELHVLLSCQGYNEKDENCVNCRSVSSVMIEGGEVALKAIQVARKLKR